MTQTASHVIADILADGRDLTLATLGPDGGPHATTVSYVSDGVDVFFGCAPDSQKARNLSHDDRVALTVNLPYRDWSEIRGLSLTGRARRLTGSDELSEVELLFLQKFPEVAQYVAPTPDAALAIFKVSPDRASILDYRQGFGHTEHVTFAPVAVMAEA